MKIVIHYQGKIPALIYGGTERVIWYLGKELKKLENEVVFMVNEGSICDFAEVIFIDKTKSFQDQVPKDADIVHFHSQVEETNIPYVVTLHGNLNFEANLDKNTIFVSKNHAERFGSNCFVYNGLDWEDYDTPDFSTPKNHFHFLGKAAWRVKNVKGAIDTIKKTKNQKLWVLGGVRFNINMGIRLTFSPRIKFLGMVGGKEKINALIHSKGLVFPVLWHEPFGLAIIESLYYGAPVFGSPYGSLPELVNDKVGFLSHKSSELAKAIENADQFSKEECSNYALEHFNSKKMALAYLVKYEKVINGEPLNENYPKIVKVQTEKFLPWEN